MNRDVKITGKRPNAPAGPRQAEYDPAAYFELDMRSHLKGSLVEKVFFHRNAVMAIFSVAEKSVLEYERKAVPEIGGFLFGNAEMTENSAYSLFVERYCHVRSPEVQTPSFLRMGIEAGFTLDRCFQDYPALSLVGWFHTHPGHGPYLSDTDLSRTHEVFFREPYQIAIVLDNLTPGFDTGVFSRKTLQAMNNAADVAQWVSWQGLSNHCKTNEQQ